MSNPIVVPTNRKGGMLSSMMIIGNRKQKTNIIWRCTHNGCGSYLKTNLFDVTDNDAVIRGNFV